MATVPRSSPRRNCGRPGRAKTKQASQNGSACWKRSSGCGRYEGKRGMNSVGEPGDPAETDYGAADLARTVGQRIKAVRMLSGLNRNQFGAKIGVCGQQIQKYETGKDTVPLHRLLRLAALCGAPLQSFWSANEASPEEE